MPDDAHILKSGQRVQVRGSGWDPAPAESCEVEEVLGHDYQGEIFRGKVGGRSVVLKWYDAAHATQESRDFLEAMIGRGSPNKNFVWPLQLAFADSVPGFGVVMKLPETRFKSFVELLKGKTKISFRYLMILGSRIAEGFLALHSRGFSYGSIGLANILFDPQTGDVLFRGNEGDLAFSGRDSPRGSPRFTAPELFREEKKCDVNTDLYALSVLLFYALMMHHPLEGKREASAKTLDHAEEQKLYGTEALFIFDPHDSSNAPVPGYQDNALVFWPIYPRFVRDLFTRAFTVGLHEPEKRVREKEWQTAMERLVDLIVYCSKCGAENFFDPDAKTPPCWKCKETFPLPMQLRVGEQLVMLNLGTQLFPHHLDEDKPNDFSKPVAIVQSHPENPAILGLKNISTKTWKVSYEDSPTEVIPEKTVRLRAGTWIDFDGTYGACGDGWWRARAQPVFIIVDCSESMRTDGKMQAVNTAMRELIPHLRQEAEQNANANFLIRVIAFSSGAQWLSKAPVPIEIFEWIDLEAGGRRDLGTALWMVSEELKKASSPKPLRRSPFLPVLVLVCGGAPTDNFAAGLRALFSEPLGKKATRTAIPIGVDADMEVAEAFIGNPEIGPIQANNPQGLCNLCFHHLDL